MPESDANHPWDFVRDDDDRDIDWEWDLFDSVCLDDPERDPTHDDATEREWWGWVMEGEDAVPPGEQVAA